MLIVFIIFLFLGVYKIIELIVDDNKLKEKSKAMGNFYQYFEDRDYRTSVSSDTYEGLYAEIQKYKDKEDTKYVDVRCVTCDGDGNLFSAFLIVTRDVDKYRELMKNGDLKKN